ncbi:hypothetical protein MFERI14815_00192 [Mycoplasma feriruminatoris]|uniref:Uncharacterized protein n=1 Tax=Mycoplasma feriruminatoris TaxID=1179777 RepID=A0A654ING4_9MOLU|nr:hypothetical protein [Mycoplasma feriruminatoris]WFQ91596.1 hypothetical protein MFERI14815_00192 [Mycoplasma feriruminatoris]VZR99642.1 hypothetical protein MF5583_00190 [Mycoplasma feriruminatoris]
MQTSASKTTTNTTVKTTSAISGVFSALVSIITSITNMIIQFLLIYWVLQSFGTEISGFVRISISLSIIGGTAEGALALSTVLMLAEPLSKKDWITVNEIYSTAKRNYRNKIGSGLILILILSILYPLQIAISPLITSGQPVKWGIDFTTPLSKTHSSLKFWELSIIFLILGFKQTITAGLLGVYENIMQADQKNATKKLVILFSDIVFYGSFFLGLNSYISLNDKYTPVLLFIPFIFYPFIRGFLIKWYVSSKYPQLKFYSDFNNLSLIRRSVKIYWSSIGQSILTNSDLIIIFLALGSIGLKVSSLISLYMVVAINLRIIMTSLVTSFKEYFQSVIIKNGRLDWETYSNYEFYTYIVGVFSFLITSIMTPYIVTGIFAKIILYDVDTSGLSKNTIEFIIFSTPFSSLFGATTGLIVLLESKITLIHAKGMHRTIAKPLNIIAFSFFITSFITTLLLNRFISNVDSKISWVIIVFYGFKIFFLIVAYLYLWVFSWDKLVYNAKFNRIIPNLFFLFMSCFLIIAVLVSTYNSKIIRVDLNEKVPVDLTYILAGVILIFILSIFIFTFIFVYNLAFKNTSLFRWLFYSLPIIKRITKQKQEKAKQDLFKKENIKIDQLLLKQEDIFKAMYGFKDNKVIDQKEFEKYSKYKPKPKTYILTSNDINKDDTEY